MTRLVITLLGAPRLELDGVPLELTARKAMALLAYLGVTGVPHTRDALATLFWPEADQEHGRGALRYTLGQLKAAIGDGWLQVSREQIGLNPQHELDIDVVQVKMLLAQVQAHGHPHHQACAGCVPLLEQAMALGHGSLLAGFSLPDSPAFDHWLFFEAEQLQRVQIDALAALVAYHRTAGTPAAAVPYAQRWLALDPLDEAVNQLLIQLYIDSDQRAAARRQYAASAKRLDGELGVAPDSATRVLIEQLTSVEPLEVPRTRVRRRPASVLPMPTTPLLGRAHELEAIMTLLADGTCHLLSLLGPGGSGKTHLALVVAQTRLASNADAVIFVPLAGLTAPEAFVSALASAVGCPHVSSEDSHHVLLAFLRDKQLLLVLDNLEHLLEHGENDSSIVTALLDAILHTAPGIQLLVTSRVRLHLYEEQVYQVHGLDYPEEDVVEKAEAYGAVQLFVQRARQVQPEFALTPDTTPRVIRTVRLLAGQPLAIELAAAWVTTLTLDEIATELRTSIDLLESQARNPPARHRSMRATYMLSWEQLQPQERAVQQALAVFRGGFSTEAAAQVAGATPRVLQALIDQSLLGRPYDLAGSKRYEMHELLRQFAAEQLARDPQHEAQVRNQHTAYYLALMETAAPALQERPDDEHWAQVRVEYDNQLAALQWMLQQKDSEGSLRLCNALSHLWDIRGQVSEGRYWLSTALALPGDPTSVARADALDTAGRLAVEQGDWDQAVDLLAQALTLSRTLGDTRRIARLLRSQGWLALMRGAYAEATALLEESVALYRAEGDQHGVARVLGLLGQAAYEQQAFARAIPLLTESMIISRTLDDSIDTAWSINKLGLVALYTGQFSDAERLLEESLAIFAALDYKRGIAWVIGSLGWVRLGQEAYARAAECFTDSLTRYNELGEKRNIAFSLERLASLAAVQEQAVRAARLFGAARALRQGDAVPLPPVDREYYAQYLALVQAKLNPIRLAAAWAEGEAMSVDGAITYALQHEDQHSVHAVMQV